MQKIFFKSATKAQIKAKELVEAKTIKQFAKLNTGQYLILSCDIIPRGYESARKFMKHGPEVKPKRFYSLDQAVKEGKTPVQLREDAFDSLDFDVRYCGYTFMPLGRDRRKRKVSLIECLDGARLFAYSHQSGEKIKIKPYDNSKRVKIDGAEVICEVPSTTEGKDSYPFKLTAVPVVDCNEKNAVSLNLGSDHSCGAKRFNIRYRYSDDKESSGIVNICSHEIAAYLQLIQNYMDRKNLIPLQMCQIAIPSQETVDFYLKLENNLLIRDQGLETKDKLRHPNRAEKEIALWDFVKVLGHDRTFYSKKSRDGTVSDYNW